MSPSTPVQFRRTAGGRAGAPFPAPDIANLLNDWLDAAQLLHWQEHGQIDFALNGLRCAAARQRRPYAWDIAGAASPS